MSDNAIVATEAVVSAVLQQIADEWFRQLADELIEDDEHDDLRITNESEAAELIEKDANP